MSKARNIGLKYAKGKYINFLDSDDKWDLNAFKNFGLFFKFNKKIDLIGGRIKYFEITNKYHILDYKFTKTRIVNLNKEYRYIQLHASSSVFRFSSIKNKTFDENLSYGEDCKFILNLIFYNRNIGLLKDAIYFYRKRADSSSAIQNTQSNINFYLVVLEHVHLYLIKKSHLLFKKIISFIQFYIAYDILFRISSPAFKYLDSNIYNKYCDLIHNIFTQIKDRYILEQIVFPSKLKVLALSKKYSRDLRNDIFLKNNYLIYSNYVFQNLEGAKDIIIWKYLKIDNNRIYIEGVDKFWLQKNSYYYFCKLGTKKIFPKYINNNNLDLLTLYGIIIKGRTIIFDILIDVVESKTLYFYISYQNKNIEICPPLNFVRYIPPINNSYYASKKFILTNIDNHLIIYPYNIDYQMYFESNYNLELKKLKKDSIIKIRKEYFEKKENNNYFNENNLWIIKDSFKKAGDNGEYFFRYLKRKKPKNLLYYFVIQYGCIDYKRLKGLGNVVAHNSKNYLNLYLNAKKLISSTVEFLDYNPFGRDLKYLNDLFNFDFIYIPNGIIKDDLSNYLNKIYSHIDIIITSSSKEFTSLLSNKYGYNKNNIILSGLPRFDNLKIIKNHIKTENLILIYPTWRRYIKGTINLLNHQFIKSEDFKNSTFYIFYNNLINDEQLLNILDKYNYKVVFCLHPNFAEQKIVFNINKYIRIKGKCRQQDILAKASILITDYSNIFFDFGYIEKPIIYYHFDYNEYRQNHIPEGYFNYERDGFGPVCKDIKCIFKNILFEIENKNKVRKKYIRRIKRFFKFNDMKNCKRLFSKIKGFRYDINLFKDDIIIGLYFIFIFFNTIKFFKKINSISIYYIVRIKI